MTTKIILDITLTIIIIYIFFIYNVEHNSNLSDTDEIINVRSKYKEDIKQIKYLYDIAKKIQIENEYLTVSQKQLIIGSDATGDIRFTDCFASGYISVGSAKINQNGDIFGNNLKLNGSISNNSNIITGSIIASANNDKGDLIQLINTQKKDDKWIISNTKSDDINNNKLSFTKMIGNTGATDNTKYISVLELYDNGDVNIPGNLKVSTLVTNNIFQKRNKARYIRVGNMITIGLPDLNGKIEEINNSELAVENNWSLIEIKVINHSGKNVALNKDVSIINSIAYRKNNIFGANLYDDNKYSNIINGIIFNGNIPHDNLSSGNVTGYFGGDGFHQLEIDLNNEDDIYSIELYNRFNGSKSDNGIHISARMNGTVVELISGDKNKPETLIINRRIHTGLWTSVYSKEYIL